jgi:hypothetical protein
MPRVASLWIYINYSKTKRNKIVGCWLGMHKIVEFAGDVYMNSGESYPSLEIPGGNNQASITAIVRL